MAGEIVTVEGPVSNMGRLDCKTPSMLALDILKQCTDDWVTISDQQALDAVKTSPRLGFLHDTFRCGRFGSLLDG